MEDIPAMVVHNPQHLQINIIQDQHKPVWLVPHFDMVMIMSKATVTKLWPLIRLV
jgi:hypothetical protein